MLPSRHLAEAMAESQEDISLAQHLGPQQARWYRRALNAKRDADRYIQRTLEPKRMEPGVKGNDTESLKGRYNTIFAPLELFSNSSDKASLEAYCDGLPKAVSDVLQDQVRADTKKTTKHLEEEVGARLQAEMMTRVARLTSHYIRHVARHVAHRVRRDLEHLKADKQMKKLIWQQRAKEFDPHKQNMLEQEVVMTYNRLKTDDRWKRTAVYKRVGLQTKAKLHHPVSTYVSKVQDTVAQNTQAYEMELMKPLLKQREGNIFLEKCEQHKNALHSTVSKKRNAQLQAAREARKKLAAVKAAEKVTTGEETAKEEDEAQEETANEEDQAIEAQAAKEEEEADKGEPPPKEEQAAKEAEDAEGVNPSEEKPKEANAEEKSQEASQTEDTAAEQKENRNESTPNENEEKI